MADDRDLELRSSIEALYETFGRYPLRRHVEGCPHCVDADDHLRLGARPLRELQRDDLARFAFKALSTWGDESDFKHFLPRLFDLASTSDGGWVDEQTLIGKLALAGWQRWSKDEQAAVERFLRAWWRVVLARGPEEASAGLVLRAIAGAVPQLRLFLDEWRDDPTPAASIQLAVFVITNEASLWSGGRVERSGFTEEQRAEIDAWLGEEKISERLEQVFFEHQDDPFAEQVSRATDALEAMKRARTAG